jgi:ssDNA-binding Zn-finger/Zn-ribbon topoisomerase 1
MKKFVENTESDILCPQCNPPRKLIVKTNRNNGNQFLGCPNYPDCKYTRGIPEEWIMRANGQPSLFDVLTHTPLATDGADVSAESDNVGGTPRR